jgi:hypothetical protein
MTEAKERLKQMEEAGLTIARNARELLLNEGWDGTEARHTKYAFVMELLEAAGELRISELAKASGRSMKAMVHSINILMGQGKVERVGRGRYRAVPKEHRLPKASLTPRPKPKRGPRKKKTVEQVLEEM